MEKRGQLGFEYLVIIGVVMVLMLPLMSYLFSSADRQLNVENAVSSVYELTLAAEEVNYLGPGSSKAMVMGEGIDSVETGPGYVKGNLLSGQVVFVPTTANLVQVEIEGEEVAVSNNNGLIEVFNAPNIDYLAPNGGPIETVVTVHGRNFLASSKVHFAEEPLETTFVNSETLTFTVPPGASGRNRVVVVSRNIASNYKVFIVT